MKLRWFILFGLFGLSTSLAKGQAQQGDLVLGGNFTGRTTLRSSVHWNHYSLTSGFGVFISPHLLVEGHLDADYWAISDNIGSTQSWGLGAAPSLTYLITKQRVTPYLKGIAEFSWSDTIDGYPEGWEPRIMGHLGVGAWFWVNQYVALQGGIQATVFHSQEVLYATSQIGLRYVWSR